MPATARKSQSSETVDAAASPSKSLSGDRKVKQQIVIIWSPAKDSAVAAAPVGSQSERTLLYSWVADPKRIDQLRSLDEEQRDSGRTRQVQPLRTKLLPIINPGLNWIEADLWDEAMADSQAKGETSDEQGYLQRLISDSAIVVITPQGDGAADMGSINAYSRADAMQIVAAEYRLPVLHQWQKEAEDSQVARNLSERIRNIEGRSDR